MSEAPRRRWWLSRPVLALTLIPGLVVLALIAGRVAGYKPFYVPSEAMEPTLKKGDRFIALMGFPADLRRGDVILIEGPNGRIYIMRLAALAGDRIAVDQGVVVLNGKPVAQGFEGEALAKTPYGKDKVQYLAEQFPGEKGQHRIYDSGFLPETDDFDEQLVRPGHVFMLGDNRDQSADSRFGPEAMGLGQVPLSNIRGKALFHSWGSSKGIGEPI